MAYFDRDEDFLVWLPEVRPDNLLPPESTYLLEMSNDQATGASGADPVCGYIIRDWFGPFLFGPFARQMRGNC